MFFLKRVRGWADKERSSQTGAHKQNSALQFAVPASTGTFVSCWLAVLLAVLLFDAA